jgi:hypothetical protein
VEKSYKNGEHQLTILDLSTLGASNMDQAMQKEEWHLDKKVPIGIIIALVIQTIAFFTVATAWKTTVDNRIGRLEEIVANNSNQGERIIILEQQLKFIVESLNRIEQKLDIVEQSKPK